nr:MAG TPA: hypothetical protein [Caudoviricetes sp.]
MANWARKIICQHHDFCLNTSKAKEIIKQVDNLSVPSGKVEDSWKYDRAYSRLKPMIMSA